VLEAAGDHHDFGYVLFVDGKRVGILDRAQRERENYATGARAVGATRYFRDRPPPYFGFRPPEMADRRVLDCAVELGGEIF